MLKRTRLLWKQQKYDQLVTANREAVKAYNQRMLPSLLLIGWVLMLLPIAAVPFSNTKAAALPAYLSALAAFLGLYSLSRFKRFQAATLQGLYAAFSVLFLLGIYLSVYHSPNMRATVLLAGFILMPLSFIDQPRRVSAYLIFWLLLHTLLAAYLKPRYALDDAINCLCAGVLGSFIGRLVNQTRLELYDAQRQLTIEKSTDVLTGLYNRRKLYEHLKSMGDQITDRPSGILMTDVDHFKYINDSLGHKAGDDCLRAIGRVMQRYNQTYHLRFYRYGGDEFIALLYGYSRADLLSIAGELQQDIKNANLSDSRVTLSIGVAFSSQTSADGFEQLMIQADQAVYVAKDIGRDQIKSAWEI